LSAPGMNDADPHDRSRSRLTNLKRLPARAATDEPTQDMAGVAIARDEPVVVQEYNSPAELPGRNEGTLATRKLSLTREISWTPSREIRVRANVSRVLNIDMQSQTFTVDVRFEASWIDRDGQLSKIASEMKRCCPADLSDDDVDHQNTDQAMGKLAIRHNCAKLGGEPLFAPRLGMANLIEAKERTEWWNFYAGASERHEGRGQEHAVGPAIICYNWELKNAVFQQVMDLHRFPFDTQELAMELKTGWDIDDKNAVIIIKNQKSKYRSQCQVSNFVQAAEYKLYPFIRFTEGRTERYESASGKSYAMLRCGLRVERLVGYWVFQVLLPLFVVTTCILSTYAVPHGEVGDRTAITVTLLLAIVAFKIVVSEKLPNISYATWIDRYVIFCFISGFLVVVMQVCEYSGVISSLVYRYRVSPAVVDASNGTNGTNGTDAQSDLGFVNLRPGEYTVEISVYLLILGSVWLALHVFILCVYAYGRIKRHVDRKMWCVHRNSVWISPVFKDGSGYNLKQLQEELGNNKDVADIIHWTPEEANRSLQSIGGKQIPEYRSSAPFAVVRFVSEEKASELVKTKADEVVVENTGATPPQYQHLDLSFAALAIRPTARRGSGGAQVAPAGH